MRRLRIGVDMDGVLINNDPVWKTYFDSNLDAHGHANECALYPLDWNEKSALCHDCFRVCVNDPGLLAAAPLMDGAQESLQALCQFADLYLVTHRKPELEETIVELLIAHDVFSHFAELRVGYQPKLPTCEKLRLDCLIDDGPKNIEDLTGSSVLPIIFNQGYNQGIEGQRVFGWGDAVRFINLWRLGALRNVKPPKGS